MIEKNKAIALRYFPTSNTSRVVTWLSNRQGKITTLIKGSQRSKSLFLGQYDLFYTCELLYYHRENREVFYTRECSPLKWRPRLRKDWRATAVASYFSSLLYSISPLHAPHVKLFDLLDGVLDELQLRGASESLFFWVELRLLQVMGFKPQLRVCLHCRKKVEAFRGELYMSVSKGGILCKVCHSRTGEKTYTLSRGAVFLMDSWQECGRMDRARRTRCSPAQFKELQKYLGLFLSYHLDVALSSRCIALDYLTKK